MTRWFDPLVLIPIAYQIWKTRNLEPLRESQPKQPARVVDYSAATDDFWFDYVADLGDAFDPTMAIAWLVGRRGLNKADIDPQLEMDAEFGIPDDIPLPPESIVPDYLPRGQLLVFGGDQVYPSGTRRAYANQLVGPYGKAWENGGPPSDVVALPTNHDWYGGLEPFAEVFCQTKPIGGWRTRQQATWWSAELAHDWWIWGVDTALDGTINQAQREYFAEVVSQMPEDARLVACVATPLWRLRQKGSEELDVLAQFFDDLDVQPEVFLSGDYHVSALHRRDIPDKQADDRVEWHLTGGGGGAFQHPVHNLDRVLPAPDSDLPDPKVADAAPFHLISNWPSMAESRQNTAGWWDLVFDRGAYSLIAFLTLIQVGVMRLAGSNRRSPTDNARSVIETFADLVWPVGLMASIGIVAVAVFSLAKSNSSAPTATMQARSVGFTHGVNQAAILTVTGLASNLAVRQTTVNLSGVTEKLVAWGTLLAVSAIGSVAVIVALGIYLRISNQWFKMHDNEAYSAKRSGDNRHFARFRITPDGALTCYIVAITETGSGWAKALRSNGDLPPASTASPRLLDVRFKTAASETKPGDQPVK